MIDKGAKGNELSSCKTSGQGKKTKKVKLITFVLQNKSSLRVIASNPWNTWMPLIAP